MFIPEITCLSGDSDAIEFEFMKREARLTELMELAIHLHLEELPFSDTVSLLDNYGVDRIRLTVQNWVQEADLEPRGGRDPREDYA